MTTTPAIGWNIVRVLEQGIAVLSAELPAVLSALEAQHGMTLPPPIRYWRSADVPADWDSPGVGLYDVASVYEQADALSAFDVVHTLQARIVLAAGGTADDDLSSFDDSIRAYGWAVAYTLSRFLALPAYGRPFGVYSCDPVDTAPSALVEATDRGQFLRFVDIRWQARQRVRKVAL